MYQRSTSGRRYGPRRGKPGNWRSHDYNPQLMTGLPSEPLLDLTVPSSLPDYRGLMPRGLKPVSSYNWTNERTPTILVPGCPPIWQNRPTPFKLERDFGRSFVDQNRFRVPKYPLLPLFVAVDNLDTNYDFKQIDLITDRNNLRKLLRWVEGSIEKDFRIDVELLGSSTIIFTRCDFPYVLEQSHMFGFGRNFEKHTTKLYNGCERSTGHHRIISYNFGKLKLMVRFEVDACLHYDGDTQARPDIRMPSRRSTRTPDDVESLVSQLSGMSIRDDEIVVEPAGLLVKQESLLEMTTRSARKIEEGGFDWQEYFPQLFLSQTPHHCLGVHESGQFRRIDMRVLRDETLRDAQKRQQEQLDRLHALLLEIRDLVMKEKPGTRLALVYRIETSKLEVFERPESMPCLPPSWMERFEERSAQTSVESESKKPEASGEAVAGTSGVVAASSTILALGYDLEYSDNSTVGKDNDNDDNW